MGEIRQVGRQTLIYGAGVALSKLASFLMLPVYTHVLSPADYGVLELLGTTIDLIAMIAGVGLAAGVFKHLAELDGDGERRRLMSTVFLGSSGMALVVMLLGLAAAAPLTRILLGPAEPVHYFRLFFVTYFLNAFNGVALLYLQAEQRARTYVALSLAKLVVNLSLTILLVVHYRMGVTGVLLATLITAALMFAGLVVFSFRRVGFAFVPARFRQLAAFGAPVVVWSVGSFILTFADRYYLRHYAGTDVVGVYSLAYKFSFLLSAFAVVPFQQGWEPRRFVIARQPEGKAVYRRMFVYFNAAMFVGAIGILLFIRDGLTILVGEGFRHAYVVVPLLLLTTVVQQYTGFCNAGIYLANATRLYGWAAVIAVVTALAGNALLIPRFGMMGAAWATVIAYVVRFVPVYLWAQARFHVDYPWRRVSVLWLLFGGCWLVRWSIDGLPLLPSIGVSVLLAAVSGAVVWVAVLDDSARGFVRRQLERPLRMLQPRGAT